MEAARMVARTGHILPGRETPPCPGGRLVELKLRLDAWMIVIGCWLGSRARRGARAKSSSALESWRALLQECLDAFLHVLGLAHRFRQRALQAQTVRERQV